MPTKKAFRTAKYYGVTALTAADLTPGRVYYLFDSQFEDVIGRFTVTKSPRDEFFNDGDQFATPVVHVLDENGNEERVQLLQLGLETTSSRKPSSTAIGQRAYIAGVMDARNLRGRRFIVDASERDRLPSKAPVTSLPDPNWNDVEEEEDE